MEKKRRIIPPVYLLISLVMTWLLHYFMPIHQYLKPPLAYAGLIPVLFGITMAAISAGMFRMAHTGLEPFEEATVLVTGGFYRFTRNPMYLGMSLMLLGVALLSGSIGALLPIPVFILIIHNHFVLGEERFLEAAFDRQYLQYKSKVRRWV